MSAGRILDALREVIDPELGINVVDLGLVERVEDTGLGVRVWLGMTSPACPAGPLMRRNARDALLRLPGVEEAEVLPAHNFRWSPERLSNLGRAQLANGGRPPVGADLVRFGSSGRDPGDDPGDDPGEEESARTSDGRALQRSPDALAWQRLPLLAAGLLS
ncbi:MAG: metal-sulfur cluster assembly factor, partial [Deltaproteobacteria bacterium]|nr:metal-sulfur cluster assembly factor [Deltaproteobacteria bacterium]